MKAARFKNVVTNHKNEINITLLITSSIQSNALKIHDIPVKTFKYFLLMNVQKHARVLNIFQPFIKTADQCTAY